MFKFLSLDWQKLRFPNHSVMALLWKEKVWRFVIFIDNKITKTADAYKINSFCLVPIQKRFIYFLSYDSKYLKP